MTARNREPRTAHLVFKVSPNEKEKLVEAAKAAGSSNADGSVNLAYWVRGALLAAADRQLRQRQ